jgi:hypothetical protein
MPYYAAGDYYSAGDSYYQAGGFSLGKLFGGIAKTAVGFATGGVVGGLTKLAGGVISKFAQHPAAQAAPPGSLPPIPTFAGQGVVQVGPSLVNFAQQFAGPGGGAVAMMAGAGGGGTGVQCYVPGHGLRRTHLNRSTYVRRGGGTRNLPPGLVVKGTECVPNRRTNPANPRALRRAIARVSGFGKLVRHAKKAVGRANTAVGNVHHARKGKR